MNCTCNYLLERILFTYLLLLFVLLLLTDFFNLGLKSDKNKDGNLLKENLPKDKCTYKMPL